MLNRNYSEESFESSTASTPEILATCASKYKIQFFDQISKNGDVVTYKFKVLHLLNGYVEHVIERCFEDFEYLEHCVMTDVSYQGLIIPPLPCHLPVDAQSAKEYSKKHMGKSSRLLLADDYKRIINQLQKYMELLLCHPVLGRSPRLEYFITQVDAPPRTKVQKTLFNKIYDTIEAKRGSVADSEEFFQHERDWVVRFSIFMSQVSTDFDKMVYSQIKMVHQLEELVLALKLNESIENSLKRMLLRSFEISKIYRWGDPANQNQIGTLFSVSAEGFACLYKDVIKETMPKPSATGRTSRV